MRLYYLLAASLMVFVVGLAGVLALPTVTITLSTDKQSYNAGDTVTFTGQVKNSGDPVPNAVVVFQLQQTYFYSKTHPVASGNVTTDQNGTYSGTFTGLSPVNGGYTIYVNVRLGNQEAGTLANFQVAH